MISADLWLMQHHQRERELIARADEARRARAHTAPRPPTSASAVRVPVRDALPAIRVAHPEQVVCC